MMKKLFFIFFICVILVGCSQRNSQEDNISNDDIPAGNSEDDISSKYMPAGERLDAIFYNGECYYGLAMGQVIKEGEEPEGFTYLGEISSIVEGYKSPTEELSATIGEVGDEVYYYRDEKGRHFFCTPIKVNYYRGICIATTEKPDYYDQ